MKGLFFDLFEQPLLNSLTTILSNRIEGLQVEWEKMDDKDGHKLPRVPVAGGSIGALVQDPTLKPIRKVKVKPVQFHWHYSSEHLIGGLHVCFSPQHLQRMSSAPRF
jgi:hypothetical protein